MGRRAKTKSRKRNRRIIWISVAVIAFVAIAAVIYIAVQSFNVTSPLAVYIDDPVSTFPTVLTDVTGVTGTTLNTVAAPSSVIAPTVVSGSPLILNGKPEVLYIGGEYCPYCAFERWAMIMAMSKFGNFTGLEYMLSSGSDLNGNTPTFTFRYANYSSQYISFVSVEKWDRAENVVTDPTTAEQALWNQYDSANSIPFVDLANSYVIVGAQSTIDLMGDNWTQVASQLNDPSSQVAQQIDGAANYLITAICKIDGAQPTSVCGQPFADQTLAYLTPASQAGQSSALILAPVRGEPRWIESASRS